MGGTPSNKQDSSNQKVTTSKKRGNYKTKSKVLVASLNNPEFIPNLLAYIGKTDQKNYRNNYLMVSCPFHPENDPSFSIIINPQGYHGRPYGFGKCFSCGASVRNVIDLIKKLKKAQYNIGPYQNLLKKPYTEKEFVFYDLDGNPLYYQEVVYSPDGRRKSAKQCKYFRKTSGGKKLYGLGDTSTRTFYGLHTLSKDMSVLAVTESPQDADAYYTAFGYPIIATAGSTTWHENFDEILKTIKRRYRNLKVIVFIPQSDLAGRKWYNNVLRRFAKIFKTDKYELKLCNVCKANNVKDLDEFFQFYLHNPEVLDEKTGHLKKATLEEVRKEFVRNTCYASSLANIKFPNGLIPDEENNVIVKLKKDEIVEVYSYIAYPVARCVDIATGEFRGFIIVKRSATETVERYVAGQTVSEYRRAFGIGSETAKSMITLIDKLVDLNEIPTKKIVSAIGWNKEGTKYISPATVDPNVEIEELEGIAERYNTEITEEEAESDLKELLKIVHEDKTIMVPILFSLLSLYFENGRGGVLELTGDSGTGKTFGMNVALTLMGTCMENWFGTKNYFNTIFSKITNCGIIGLDELHVGGNIKSIIDTYYSVTNGKTKGRLSKDAIRVQRDSYTLGLMVTGEFGILDAIDRYVSSSKEMNITPVGAANRVLSLRVKRGYGQSVYGGDKELTINRKMINYLAKKLKGWLLRLWIKYNPHKDAFKVDYRSDSHVISYVSTMRAILDRMKEIGWLTEEQVTASQFLLGELYHTTTDSSKTVFENSHEPSELEDWCLANIDKFVELSSKEAPEKVPREGIYGFYECKEDVLEEANQDGDRPMLYTFYFFDRKLRRVCGELGISYVKLKEYIVPTRVWIPLYKNNRKLKVYSFSSDVRT